MNLHDEIAAISYELFESRGCVHGFDIDDWLNAERIVLGTHAGQEMEEPEEEEGLEEFALVGTKRAAPQDETEEPVNEEMS